jgi:hypothetical protein
VRRELLAASAETWSEDDYEEEPSRRRLVADIEAGRITPDVLDFIEDVWDRDWYGPKEHRAFLSVLARAGRLERWSPDHVWYGRKPRTMVVDGVRYYI